MSCGQGIGALIVFGHRASARAYGESAHFSSRGLRCDRVAPPSICTLKGLARRLGPRLDMGYGQIEAKSRPPHWMLGCIWTFPASGRTEKHHDGGSAGLRHDPG